MKKKDLPKYILKRFDFLKNPWICLKKIGALLGVLGGFWPRGGGALELSAKIQIGKFVSFFFSFCLWIMSTYGSI